MITKVTVAVCDRCEGETRQFGEVSLKQQGWRTLAPAGGMLTADRTFHGGQIHLCENCAKSFEQWMGLIKRGRQA